jgi:flagellar motor switch protein FliN
MAELTPQIVGEVVAACQAGAAEAADAFRRALDAEMAFSVGEPSSLDMQTLPEDLNGPGLAIVLTSGAAAALVLLPEATKLVPAWCAEPDATGQSKLATLAQELGMLMLPEQFTPDAFQAARVKNLAGALKRGGVEDGAAMVPLELSATNRGVARLIWPAPNPAMVLGAATTKPKPESKPEAKPAVAPKAESKPSPPAPQPQAARRTAGNKGRRELPGYTRSLLRVQVPVVVTLAENRQPLRRILALGPGSIIQFEKSCDEMLDLSVGNHPIASGEAVKVGDKFGLRITSMIMPEERFQAVQPVAKS